ncbi:HalOD1 output domain-containing protein [Halegenticoccus tardaugens]|uniref:HalOD1 output domain-containing protein n=1 Tax=Halegenticoccus tardaugens TaxID=2071624 RepID=UPI00100A47FB|nr:HalOD1 output domain-containing protein [Halegenticoccus tardaugens]
MAGGTDRSEYGPKRTLEGQSDAGGRVLHEAWYDPTEDSGLCSAILFAVGTAIDADPLEVQFSPLHERIDTDALETALFGPKAVQRGNVRGEVAFDYEDVRVSVRTDGRIQIRDLR